MAAIGALVASACGDNEPPASCTDGTQNGSETSVDCGGACGAICELGARCTAGTDCLFGACSEGRCAAPTEGPAPTGPISATIAPEGGTLSVVTDERVAVVLTFPPGAVSAPLGVTLTPHTPTQRSWIELQLEPTGIELQAPVAFSVELPPQVLQAADGLLAFGTGAPAMYVDTAVASHVLTGSAAVLGLPWLPDGALPRTAPFIDPADLLFAVPLSLKAQVELAKHLVTLLSSTNRYGDALRLISLVSTIALRSGDPEFEALVQPLVDQAFPVACQGITDAAIQLEFSNPKCPSEYQRFARPALNWVALATKLSGLVETPSCSASDRPNGGLARYEQALRDAAKRTETNMEMDRLGYLRCECRETPQDEWSGVQRIECPRIGTSPRLTAPAVETLFDVPGDWDVAVDSIERTELEVLKTQLVGLAGEATAMQTEVVDPLVSLLRRMTYASCQHDGHAQNVGKLLRVVPTRGELIEDAQYCASPLRVEPLAADASTPVGQAVSLGAADEPGPQQNASDIGVADDGWLRLRGPLGALRCPDKAESEPDELVAIVRTSSGDTEVARRSAGAQGLLASPLDLEIAQLRTAAGLTAGQPTDIRLALVRATTACDGLYGSTMVTLFELRLVERKVIHLKFDDAGTVATDSSGHGRDATLSGGASFGAGQCGGALSVPGQGPIATGPIDPAFDPTGDYTISAWINYTDNNQYGHWIATTQPDSSIDTGWQLYLFDWGATGPTYLQFRIPPTGACNYGVGNLSSGVWHHIAVAGTSGGPFTLYLDGSAIGSSSGSCTLVPSGLPLRIGGHPDCSSCGFDGLIDDFRIYDRKLSASEIVALAGPTCGY